MSISNIKSYIEPLCDQVFANLPSTFVVLTFAERELYGQRVITFYTVSTTIIVTASLTLFSEFLVFAIWKILPLFMVDPTPLDSFLTRVYCIYTSRIISSHLLLNSERVKLATLLVFLFLCYRVVFCCLCNAFWVIRAFLSFQSQVFWIIRLLFVITVWNPYQRLIHYAKISNQTKGNSNTTSSNLTQSTNSSNNESERAESTDLAEMSLNYFNQEQGSTSTENNSPVNISEQPLNIHNQEQGNLRVPEQLLRRLFRMLGNISAENNTSINISERPPSNVNQEQVNMNIENNVLINATQQLLYSFNQEQGYVNVGNNASINIPEWTPSSVNQEQVNMNIEHNVLINTPHQPLKNFNQEHGNINFISSQVHCHNVTLPPVDVLLESETEMKYTPPSMQPEIVDNQFDANGSGIQWKASALTVQRTDIERVVPPGISEADSLSRDENCHNDSDTTRAMDREAQRTHNPPLVTCRTRRNSYVIDRQH